MRPIASRREPTPQSQPPQDKPLPADIHAWAGEPYPLGATFDGLGTNFSVFSEVADRVELCLYDKAGHETRVELPEMTGYSWHGYLPSIGPGQQYGYRIHGPWDPSSGLRCNPAKLLLDPYALAIDGDVRWDAAVFGQVRGEPHARNDVDSAPFVPRSVVVDPDFDWGDDTRPGVPDHETIVYETHVKGLTAQHPDVPPELRGTYAGAAHPAVIAHLHSLGVTSVELMPVHQFVHDEFLLRRGLRNYWGYSSIGFLAPHGEYSASGTAGQQVHEFKAMVKTFHAGGLEVILDVVYNHTGEGDHDGPTLSWRGLDNRAYYRLLDQDPSRYMDYTGTGNSLNMREPHALQLVMDSLRYWITEMHVDGFRFDLASALARELHEVDRLSAFFDIIQQDPVIRTAKLIAEPWDVGEGGYQVGNFPAHWSEWNDRFRNTVRDLWRGEPGTLADFGRRFTGSSDLYESTGRRPHASVNLVTAHDGFTLADLVSYGKKHNEANGDGNADGESYNRSWNCGVEGPTDDPAVSALRARQQRNLLATLFLSQGVPMLLGGDELGRTQGGNNNAYSHDSELSWYDWEGADEALLDYTRRLIAFRREHPVFRRRRWFPGHASDDDGAATDDQAVAQIEWCTADGTAMADRDWHGAESEIGVFLSGGGLVGIDGEAVPDDSFYLIFNASTEGLDFKLPSAHLAERWTTVLDTAAADPFSPANAVPLEAGELRSAAAHSMVVLKAIG